MPTSLVQKCIDLRIQLQNLPPEEAKHIISTFDETTLIALAVGYAF